MKSVPQPKKVYREDVPLKEEASVARKEESDAGQMQTIWRVWRVRDSLQWN